MATPNEEAQKARAARLREKIEEELKGSEETKAKKPETPLPSPREFIQRKMAQGKKKS